MQAQPMQPAFPGGSNDPKDGSKVGKWISNFVKNTVIPWLTILFFLWLAYQLVIVRGGKKVGDVWFEAGTENIVLHPKGWETVSGKPWTALTLKAANPKEEKYLYARAMQANGRWTSLMPLATLMAMDINVGPGRQGFIEVGMGSSDDCPDSIRVLVIRNGIAHK